MLGTAKRSQQLTEEDIAEERRNHSDRRSSEEEIRFPFIDDNHRLVMKDRRSADRRLSDTKFKNHPLKAVSKFFKKN